MEDLRSNDNKKVIGKFKDECNSLLITEFLALTNKVYSFRYQAVNKPYKVVHKKVLFKKIIIKKFWKIVKLIIRKCVKELIR